MKAVPSVLVIAAMLVACDGAIAPRSFRSTIDDSLVPEPLRAAYLEDATRLALRDLQAQGSTEILIPNDAIQPYYSALVLVYNATVLPARDSVVDVYQIHTSPEPATRRLFVLVAADQEWAQRLAQDSVPTGNALVDQLLSDYALSFEHVYHFSTDELLILLRSALDLNVAALAPQFGAAPGVRFSEPNGSIGDGNNITGSVSEARVLLDYSVGYGDCPAGCIARRFYHFAVHDDGTVEYLGASGSPPP